MFQDVQPHRFDNVFKAREPRDDDYVVALHKGKPLFTVGEQEAIPTVAVMRRAYPDAGAAPQYLLTIDEHAFFLYPEALAEREGFQFLDVQTFRDFQPSWLAFAGATAVHLAQWYARNRFCGACGDAMRPKGDERALLCDACGSLVFPSIAPAVIVAVVDGDRILFTRYANRVQRRMSLVAGFMEIGETFEETVRREVTEEVGLRVKNIRYYQSQPWAFSGSVLVGYFADLDGAPDITLDAIELSEGTWVERKDIPEDILNISLTSEMMDAFRRNEYPR